MGFNSFSSCVCLGVPMTMFSHSFSLLTPSFDVHTDVLSSLCRSRPHGPISPPQLDGTRGRRAHGPLHTLPLRLVEAIRGGSWDPGLAPSLVQVS